MIKAILRDGSVHLFPSVVAYEHNSDHKLFILNAKHQSIMIPDDAIAIIGEYDEETGDFI